MFYSAVVLPRNPTFLRRWTRKMQICKKKGQRNTVCFIGTESLCDRSVRDPYSIPPAARYVVSVQ